MPVSKHRRIVKKVRKVVHPKRLNSDKPVDLVVVHVFNDERTVYELNMRVRCRRCGAKDALYGRMPRDGFYGVCFSCGEVYLKHGCDMTHDHVIAMCDEY